VGAAWKGSTTLYGAFELDPQNTFGALPFRLL
jgi:hypothetical protein